MTTKAKRYKDREEAEFNHYVKAAMKLVVSVEQFYAHKNQYGCLKGTFDCSCRSGKTLKMVQINVKISKKKIR